MTDVRRNAFLLALGLVFQSGMIQLAVALGTVTIVAVTGVHSILGLGPAVFLIAGALAVGPAGRLSDRFGRMPVIRTGYALGIVGPLVTAAGCNWRAGRPRLPRARPVRRRAVDRAALTRRRGRDVPAGAPRARHVDRALRRRVRRDLGAARLRADVLGPPVRRARPDRAVARGRACSRWPGFASRSAIRRDPRDLSEAYVAPTAPRAARGDPPPAGCRDRDGRGRQQLRRDGRRDEPRRLRRRRAPPPAGKRLHDHQHPHRRDVRARAVRRRRDRADRAPAVDGDRPRR